MGVDGRVAGRAGQVLVLAVRYVLAGAAVAVFLGQAKVDQEQLDSFMVMFQNIIQQNDVNGSLYYSGDRYPSGSYRAKLEKHT